MPTQFDHFGQIELVKHGKVVFHDTLVARVETAPNVHNNGVFVRQDETSDGIIVISAAHNTAHIAHFCILQFGEVIVYTVD